MRAILIALVALLFAVPCAANLLIVHTGHPTAVVPNLPDPNSPGNDYIVSEATNGNSIGVVLSGAAAADTVYVHSGTYDERVLIAHWNADNVTLIGPQDKTAEIRYTGSAINYSCAVGDRVSGFTGGTVKWMRLDGDGGVDNGFMLSGAEDATITECVTEGNFKSVMLHGAGFTVAGNECSTVTVEACSLSASRPDVSVGGAAIDIGTGGSVGAPDGITFSNTVFEFADHHVGTDGIRFRGATNLVMENCTINLPRNTQASSGFGISAWSESPTLMTSGLVFRDLTITAQEMGASASDIVVFGLGRYTTGGQDNIVEDVLVERVTINVPAIDLHFGLKVEADYNGTVGADASFSDNIRIIDTTVIGGRTGIGFHENTRNSTMARCRIIGPGNTADAGYQTFGIVIEDARHVNIIDNWISNVEKALTMSHSGDLLPGNGFHNYNVRIIGNVFENATKGINLQYFENTNTVVVDSLMIEQGNLFRGVTSIGYLDVSGTDTDFTSIALWKAYAVPVLGTSPHLWTHASGDTDDITGLISGGGLPQGLLKSWGNSGYSW